MYLLVGALSVAAGLVLAWLLPSMLTLSPDLVRPAQAAAVIAVVTLGTQAPLGLFGTLLKGAQRFDVPNTGALISILAYAALVLVVLTRHATLPVLATIAFVATLIRLLYPLLFIRRGLPGLRLSRSLVSRSEVKSLLGFSWFAFIGHIAGKVLYSADLILVGMILWGQGPWPCTPSRHVSSPSPRAWPPRGRSSCFPCRASSRDAQSTTASSRS